MAELGTSAVRAKLNAKKVQVKAMKAQLKAKEAEFEAKQVKLAAMEAQLKAKEAEFEAKEMTRMAKEAEFEAEEIAARDAANRMTPVLTEDIAQFGYLYFTNNMIVTSDKLAAENTDKAVSLGGGFGYIGAVHGAVIGGRPLKGKAEFEVKIVSQDKWGINIALQWCERGCR